MLEALLLLTAGVGVGRLWQWLKARTHVTECPRCAIEDRLQQHYMEVGAIKRRGEERLRRVATQYPSHRPNNYTEER